MSTAYQVPDQPLPHNADGERAVLGAILIDNGLMPHAVELFPEDGAFYVPSHRKVFSAMKALFSTGSEIDPILLAEELRRRGELESVGGVSSIALLTHGLPRVD